MTFVLGLDQGGSHTWAVVAGADGRLLGQGRAGGACHAAVGMAGAMTEVDRAAREAIRAAGLEPAVVDLILGGLTGVDWPDEYDLLAKNIRGLGLAGQVGVTNDSIIALRGGTAMPYGVILIAGSGGNVAVRSPAGDEYHYGYYHDAAYQGGGALVEHAFTAIFRANSFRAQPTLLTDLFCARLGFPSVDALARAYFDGRLREAALLAPLVFSASEQGDPAAQEIVRFVSHGYAEMARAALLHFRMQELEVDVVLSGGVFKSPSRLLRETILTEVRQEIPLARLVEARYEPVVGAALLGLERLGVNTTGREFCRTLDESARELGLLREVPE
jgi:N-acetylglucosamine kinase-like BadF-type ATPase